MDFKYPYTDFHELNLDWFLAEFKKLTAEWLQVQQDWEDEQQAFQDLHDYVENYFANLDLYQEVHDILWSPEMQGNIQIILSNLTTNMLPSVVADQITAVVASQLSTVVALQLPAVVEAKLPAALPAAVAGEAAAWLADHVDPGTGYVIDRSLTISNAAADAKVVGDLLLDIDPERISKATLTGNLYNYHRRTDGYHLNPGDGTISLDAAYAVSDYIPVTTGKMYYGSGGQTRYCFYDSSKTFISGSSSTLAIVAPVNAAYLRIDMSSANISNAIVEESTCQYYPSFKVKYEWLDDPEIGIANIKDGIYINLFDKTNKVNGQYIDPATGQSAPSATYFRSRYLPAKENTSYTMSLGNRYCCYDSDHQFISGAQLNGTNVSFTTPANTAYIIVCNTPLTYADDFIVAESSVYNSSKKEHKIIIPWLEPNVYIPKSKLEGKRLVCMGDSITNYGYTDTIKNETGMICTNVGLSSGRYAYSDDSNVYVNAFAFHNICYSISTGDWTIPDTINGVVGYETQYAHIQAIKAIDFNTIDFVSIAYGTNDFSSATPLDNPQDPLDTNYFKGSIRYSLKLLTEKYPKLKIIGVTPCFRFWSSGGVITDDSDTHVIGGMLLTDYVQAVKDVYAEYHLPCIDNYTMAGINKYNCLTYFSISDGLHPNATGRALIGSRIGDGILKNY